MRLSQLRYFIEIAKTKSLTKAAKKLLVSQPSLTVSIKNLEEELDVSLFTRVKKRLQLTKEGEYYYRELEKILGNLDDLNDIMKEFGTEQRSVKIGSPPMTASFILPKIFMGFQKKYPDINLEVFEYGALESKRLLKEGKLDLAIMIEVEDVDNYDTKENRFKLNKETYFRFYVSEGHPFIGKDKVTFEDLKKEPLILFNSGFYINKYIMNKFEEIGVRKPNILLRTGQVTTVKRFISEGIASGFLIEDCVETFDKIVEVPLEEKIPISIGLEWNEKDYPSDNVMKLIDYIMSN